MRIIAESTDLEPSTNSTKFDWYKLSFKKWLASKKFSRSASEGKKKKSYKVLNRRHTVMTTGTSTRASDQYDYIEGYQQAVADHDDTSVTSSSSCGGTSTTTISMDSDHHQLLEEDQLGVWTGPELGRDQYNQCRRYSLCASSAAAATADSLKLPRSFSTGSQVKWPRRPSTSVGSLLQPNTGAAAAAAATSTTHDRSTCNDALHTKSTHNQNFRVFVGTWNVGGRPPEDKPEILEEWLGSLKEPADIYVIGFQEVVPLSAGNVLGPRDNNAPAAQQWQNLIRHTLDNNHIGDTHYRCSCLAAKAKRSWRRRRRKSSSSSLCCNYDTSMRNSQCNASASFYGGSCRRSFSIKTSKQIKSPWQGAESTLFPMDFTDPSSSFMKQDMADHGQCAGSYSISRPTLAALNSNCVRNMSRSCTSSTRDDQYEVVGQRVRYTMIASKQMVGLYVSVWVKNCLRESVRNVNVSCIGCGLMGYLGNKGSISVSMCIHQTTFCFVCSHLASGQKDGDEIRRNADVAEILKRTQFRRSHGAQGDQPEAYADYQTGPESILEHDRVIWLGDLNYRLALSPDLTRSLLAREDWEALLEKDQLQMQRNAGRVFSGWQEGRIYFAPTYKYRANSDCYTYTLGTGSKGANGGSSTTSKLIHIGEKKRAPAWCDRILWYGSGLKQLAYVRAETKFSDHKPVYAVFSAQVEVVMCEDCDGDLGDGDGNDTEGDGDGDGDGDEKEKRMVMEAADCQQLIFKSSSSSSSGCSGSSSSSKEGKVGDEQRCTSDDTARNKRSCGPPVLQEGMAHNGSEYLWRGVWSQRVS